MPSAGCPDLGPDAVARGRAENASSISVSWKRQALLNIIQSGWSADAAETREKEFPPLVTIPAR